MSEAPPYPNGSPPRSGGTSLTHIVARNTAYNLFTQGFLVVVAVWSLPLVIKGLSKDGFGLLSLVWAFIGYFSLLDFGISRANTKFLSESVATGNVDEIRNIVWTSLTASLLLGLVSGGAIVLAAPFLVHNVFDIGPAFRGDAERAFMIAGVGVPFMLLFGTLKGFQMALQRFDVFNTFQGITSLIQWGGSVALLQLGYGFGEIILLTVGVRIVLSLVAFGILPRLIPNIFDSVHLWDRSTFRKLLSFGGWVMASQVISPLFLYLDRFFLGMLLSLTAVAYYTVPHEALTRMLVVPASLVTTLFPAMSEQSVLPNEQNRINLFYHRSLKYLAIMMLPLVLGFLLFAPEILSLWLGDDFAAHTVVIFRILAVGLFINSIAHIPLTALHAFGHPDITVKFNLIELPIVVLLNLVLIPQIGVAGAAIAWTSRVTIDAALLLIAAKRQVERFPKRAESITSKGKPLVVSVITVATVASVFLVSDTVTKIVVAVLFCGSYIAATWFQTFDDLDRNFFLQFRARMLS